MIFHVLRANVGASACVWVCRMLGDIRRALPGCDTRISSEHTHTHVMMSLVSLSVCTSEGISERGKSHSHHSPAIRFPISYNILDPMTRLLQSFKACSKERGIPNSNISLSLYSPFTLVYVMCCRQRALVGFDKQSRHHKDPITKAKDTNTHTHTHTHARTNTHTHTEEHSKKNVVIMGLPSASAVPFVGNKMNNRRVLHEFHMQHITSLKISDCMC